jgi:hypothetical protein
LIAVYAAVFMGVLVSNSTPKIPRDTLGLDLNEAYYDLHKVIHYCASFISRFTKYRFPLDCRTQHPFKSRANDIPRDYILARLKNITYSFDGSNVLVKVQGADSEFSESGGVFL